MSLFHIAETREKARQNVQHGIQAFCDYFNNISTFPIVPADAGDPYTYLVETSSACIGTPDDAIAYIERLQEGSGGFGAILELAHNWADWAETKRHYELMARYVHPHFQRSRELRRASYDYARDNHSIFFEQGKVAVQNEIDRRAAAQKREAAE